MIGERLVAEGKLSARDLDRALSAQRETGGLLGRVLVRLGLVSELDVATALAGQMKLSLVLAVAFPAAPPMIEQVTPEFFRTHRILPLDVRDDVLQVVMATPQDEFARRALQLTSRLVRGRSAAEPMRFVTNFASWSRRLRVSVGGRSCALRWRFSAVCRA